MILGWIQVDRMMVVGLGMDVVVIFDIIEYGVLLLDRIKKGLGKALRYQNVGIGWRNGGIREKGAQMQRISNLNPHRFPIKNVGVLSKYSEDSR